MPQFAVNIMYDNSIERYSNKNCSPVYEDAYLVRLLTYDLR